MKEQPTLVTVGFLITQYLTFCCFTYQGYPTIMKNHYEEILKGFSQLLFCNLGTSSDMKTTHSRTLTVLILNGVNMQSK